MNTSYISSYDEEYAPPAEEVLEVSVVGGVAFLAIGKWQEGYDSSSFKSHTQIAVDVDTLAHLLAAGFEHDARAPKLKMKL